MKKHTLKLAIMVATLSGLTVPPLVFADMSAVATTLSGVGSAVGTASTTSTTSTTGTTGSCGGAATLTCVYNAIETDLIKSTLDPFITYYHKLMDAVDTTYTPAAALANTSFTAASVLPYIKTQVDQRSLQKIMQTLSQQNAAQQIQAMSVLPASDTAPSTPAPTTHGSVAGLMAFMGKSQGNAQAPATWNDNDRRLYAGSILEKNALTSPTDVNNAEESLVFLTDSTTPLSSIDPTQLSSTQLQQMASSPDGQKFIVHVRTLTAYRSLALSNLYSLILERTPVKNLGALAGLPNHSATNAAPAANNALPGNATSGTQQQNAGPDASPLEVEEYIATRRVDNPQWYTDMANASPPVIARETLFVLAEMEKELFQIKQQNERILATLTVMEVQSLQATKILPDKTESDLRQELGLAPSGPISDIENQVNQAQQQNQNNPNNSDNTNNANNIINNATSPNPSTNPSTYTPPSTTPTR